MMNILNGGSHATTRLIFREFMIMPRALRRSQAALGNGDFHHLKNVLKKARLQYQRKGMGAALRRISSRTGKLLRGVLRG
jgi:enolase